MNYRSSPLLLLVATNKFHDAQTKELVVRIYVLELTTGLLLVRIAPHLLYHTAVRAIGAVTFSLVRMCFRFLLYTRRPFLLTANVLAKGDTSQIRHYYIQYQYHPQIFIP